MSPANKPFRIVSLVPSLTETLCHFRLESALVGCTSFCVEPKSLRNTVPSVGGTKDADLERIVALKPTHIVTNREENTEVLLNSLREKSSTHGFTLIETFLEFPEDNFQLIAHLGQCFSFELESQKWCAEQRQRLDTLRTLMTAKNSFRFAYFIWMKPWMCAGHQTYISRCIELIGGQNLIMTGTELNERYPELRATDARLHEADCLFFSSEPFPFKNRHIEAFQQEAGRKFKFLKVDGQALSWYGSRFAVTLTELESMRVQIEKV
ncbi:MAG: cobalamin-binding protein [Betaproteobacteria bacterium]|nr:cobalamin-binding protein [Betaproteobacteria bacterium]